MAANFLQQSRQRERLRHVKEMRKAQELKQTLRHGRGRGWGYDKKQDNPWKG
jgi:hypothetical protein